jgi:hypothetical protein
MLSGAQTEPLFASYAAAVNNTLGPKDARRLIAHLSVQFWEAKDGKNLPVKVKADDLCAFSDLAGVACQDRLRDSLTGRTALRLPSATIRDLVAAGVSVVAIP